MQALVVIETDQTEDKFISQKAAFHSIRNTRTLKLEAKWFQGNFRTIMVRKFPWKVSRKLENLCFQNWSPSTENFLNSGKQAFSQDLKSGRPKCAIGPAQMKNL